MAQAPAPPAIAASSAMIATPSSANRAAVSSSRRNRASCQSRRSNTASRATAAELNACRSRACFRRRPARGHSGRVRHQAWLACCLFIQTWIPPNTRLPLVWFQIARSGAFYFAFPHPAACPRFDQYAPKTSRKGSSCTNWISFISLRRARGGTPGGWPPGRGRGGGP